MTSSKNVPEASTLCRKAIFWWLPLLYLLISSAFYLRTYDSAQVKITLMQMGGVCLLGLWLCRLVEEGWMSFTSNDLVCVAPFLAFLAWGIFSFIHAPYHWSSLDFFIRRIVYMTVALILIKEFNTEGITRLIRMLIWGTWIAVAYGVLQWFDFHFFPPGPGMGIDPFIWRGAFGDRIFSTYGNPNFFADYLVLMFPVLACQFFKTRQRSLLVLILLDLFNIYETQTKGAWIGLALSAVLLAGSYAYLFQWEKLEKHILSFVATLCAVILLTLGGVMWKLKESFTSVNFRLFTWEATWEMIMTQPLLGTGIGSFWVIYPAFRRPPIFHIEGKHNTETDHSEDEYLEVLFDEGIIGFGIFIWLIASTFVIAYRALAQMTGSLKLGERAPPRAYDLLGFLVALQGMLAHNFFDVSMRFVSSGIYIGLLSGVVVNLSRGCVPSDTDSRHPAQPNENVSSFGLIPRDTWAEPMLWVLRLGTLFAMGFFLLQFIRQFSDLQSPLEQIRNNGEFLQWAIAWICLLYCTGRLGYYFGRIVWVSRNVLVPIIVLAALPTLNLFWGFFRADVHQNMAIAYSRLQQWDGALKSYHKVAELNPSYIMAYYFTGNVFNDRFNMVKVYNPDWGDTNDVARDDFERALAAYDQVRARSPNYVQTLHQLGNLYLKYGDWLNHQGHGPEGQRAWDKALEYFEMYRKIDPVFAPNYYRIAQIYVVRRQYDKAIETYLALIQAKECQADPKLLANDSVRETLLSYQSYVLHNGQWVHQHEFPEAFTDLGSSFWMKGDLMQAERAFHAALSLDPNFGPAKKNLQLLYQRLKAGSSRVPAAPNPMRAPAVPTFELAPSIK